MFAAPLLAIASGVVSAAGAMQQGNAQADAAEYNANVRDQQAQNERERARAEAQDFRRKESSKLATSRANAAGSGFTLEGTPLLVDESAVREGALGAMRIGNAGAINATRYENEAKSQRDAAKSYRRAGRLNALSAGINAGSSLLSGMGSFF